MRRFIQHIRWILPHIALCLVILWLNDISWASGVTEVWTGTNTGELKNNSILDPGDGDFAESARQIFADIVSMVRLVVIGLALIVLAQVWYMWVIWMGDEEIYVEGRYKILLVSIGLFAVYVSELLYTIITGNSYVEEGFARKVGSAVSTSDPGGVFNESSLNQCNYFFCPQNFWGNWTTIAIVKFFEVATIATTVVMFIYTGARLFMRGGTEDYVTIAKKRVIYGAITLVAVWFVEWFYRAIFFWWGLNTVWLMAQIMKVANFAVFLAGPVAILLLIIWWYFYVTAAGDEERADHGKRIVLYTFLATILLILSYTFLIEIIKFNITY